MPPTPAGALAGTGWALLCCCWEEMPSSAPAPAGKEDEDEDEEEEEDEARSRVFFGPSGAGAAERLEERRAWGGK